MSGSNTLVNNTLVFKLWLILFFLSIVKVNVGLFWISFIKVLFVCMLFCLFVFSFYNFGFWLKFWMFFFLLLFLLLFTTLDFKNGCQYTSFCHGKAALLSILRVIIWCLILLRYSFPGISRELFTWQLYFIGKSKKAGKCLFSLFLLRIFIIIVCTNYNDVNLFT